MFISGLLVGMGVSLLTVIILRLFKQERLLDNQEYMVEIRSGQGYHSGVIKFNKVDEKRTIK